MNKKHHSISSIPPFLPFHQPVLREDALPVPFLLDWPFPSPSLSAHCVGFFACRRDSKLNMSSSRCFVLYRNTSSNLSNRRGQKKSDVLTRNAKECGLSLVSLYLSRKNQFSLTQVFFFLATSVTSFPSEWMFPQVHFCLFPCAAHPFAVTCWRTRLTL